MQLFVVYTGIYCSFFAVFLVIGNSAKFYWFESWNVLLSNDTTTKAS